MIDFVIGINILRGNFLSKAGRKILIKSVAQSLPMYCMNVFLIPVPVTVVGLTKKIRT